MIPVKLEGSFSETGTYPLAMINVTNRCNLKCSHCFIYYSRFPTAPGE